MLVPFAGYAFNKAHSAAYGLVSVLDRLSQGELPGRVHGRAADLGEGRQGQVGALSERVPPHGHHGAAARCQRLGRQLRRRSATTSSSACPRCATSARTSSTRSSRRRKEKGKFTSFPDFLDKVEAVVCNKRTDRVADQGGRLRLAGSHPQGPADGARAGCRRRGRCQAQGGRGPVRPLRRRWAMTPTTGSGLRRRRSRPAGVGQEAAARPGAGDARPLRLRPSALRHRARPRRRRPTLDRHSSPGGEHPDGAIVTIGGIISGLQRKMTKQGNAWAIATVEDLAGSVECMFFPARPISWCSTQLVEDAVVFVKGRLDARGRCRCSRHGDEPAGHLARPTNAPVMLTIPSQPVTPPMVEQLGEILCHHKGVTEVRIKLTAPGKTTVLRLDGTRVQRTRRCSATSRRCSVRTAWCSGHVGRHRHHVSRRRSRHPRL